MAISSLLGKIFYLIVLTEQCKSLQTNKLQFGFKQHLSTVICTALLKDTIEYYIKMVVIVMYYYLMHQRPLIVWNM